MMTALENVGNFMSADGSHFLRGVEQFNRGEFFEAHETWEALWLPASGQEKVFLQAIIQVAAAFHHWQHGNRRGALSLLRRGMNKLEALPASFCGVRLDRLLRQTGNWVAALGAGQTPHLPLPAIEVDSTSPRQPRE